MPTAHWEIPEEQDLRVKCKSSTESSSLASLLWLYMEETGTQSLSINVYTLKEIAELAPQPLGFVLITAAFRVSLHLPKSCI